MKFSKNWTYKLEQCENSVQVNIYYENVKYVFDSRNHQSIQLLDHCHIYFYENNFAIVTPLHTRKLARKQSTEGKVSKKSKICIHLLVPCQNLFL